MTHRMTIAGVTRDLPICKVTDDLYIGAFIMFGDAEITVACAKELLARAPKDYDYLLTAEAKSIPLIHEMARQSGAKTYFVARKGLKVYLTDPLCVDVNSITTQHEQHLYLSGADAALMRGKRILIVDDVISTGESLKALEKLVEEAGATVAAAWPSLPRATHRSAATLSIWKSCRSSMPTAPSRDNTYPKHAARTIWCGPHLS